MVVVISEMALENALVLMVVVAWVVVALAVLALLESLAPAHEVVTLASELVA